MDRVCSRSKVPSKVAGVLLPHYQRAEAEHRPVVDLDLGGERQESDFGRFAVLSHLCQRANVRVKPLFQGRNCTVEAEKCQSNNTARHLTGECHAAEVEGAWVVHRDHGSNKAPRLKLGKLYCEISLRTRHL